MDSRETMRLPITKIWSPNMYPTKATNQSYVIYLVFHLLRFKGKNSALTQYWLVLVWSQGVLILLPLL